MAAPPLTTKLYILPPRPLAVIRSRLVGRLHEGLPAGHKLALISAPAGFGKTTLVSEWIAPKVEEGVLGALQSSPPPMDVLLTALLNDLSPALHSRLNLPAQDSAEE